MTFTTVRNIVVVLITMYLAACSSTPQGPDYRADAQRQQADKNQQELSRETKKKY